MNTLMKTNALPSLIENFFGREFDGFLGQGTQALHQLPAVNVIEHTDGFRIEVAAPGLKKEDFKLNLNHQNLTIAAQREEREEKKEEKFTRREFSYTSFQRTFTLPTFVDVDAIQASYNDGILAVELPKREEAKVKPVRTIAIG